MKKYQPLQPSQLSCATSILKMVGVKVGMNAIRLDTAYDDAIFETYVPVCTRSLNPKNERRVHSKRKVQEVSLETRRTLPHVA